jgi:predicted adenine nucleotide alpha hydrolase (AANH) superfamily ATPase
MPPHVVLAHAAYSTTPSTEQELQAIAAPSNAAPRVLLHSCCAPCSGAMIHEMSRLSLNISIFFYNPNIHPRREYEIRKEENKRFAEKLGIPFVDCDYDSKAWFERAAGME